MFSKHFTYWYLINVDHVVTETDIPIDEDYISEIETGEYILRNKSANDIIKKGYLILSTNDPRTDPTKTAYRQLYLTHRKRSRKLCGILPKKRKKATEW